MGHLENIPKKTKRIIWVYCGENDLKDYYHEKKIKILNNYLNDRSFSQKLVFKQKKIDDLLIERISKNESSYKLRFFKLYNLRTLLFGRWSAMFQNNKERQNSQIRNLIIFLKKLKIIQIKSMLNYTLFICLLIILH